jgi:hypothetical protein
MRRSSKDMRLFVDNLQAFLTDKDVGGQVAAECIQSYSESLLTREVLTQLRSELKSIRDGADFALRQLRGI